jgi:hypothetical protein
VCSGIDWLLCRGGFLTGVHLDDAQIEEGSHFDPKLPFGAWFTSRYFPMRDELRKVKVVAVSVVSSLPILRLK